jgi:hypothetical protein
MSNHTPGPWEIKLHPDDGYRYISGPKHIGLAQVVWCMSYEERSPVCEANARLIAAAPELLEALENLLKVHEGEGGTQRHAGDIARAAIEKAKGE